MNIETSFKVFIILMLVIGISTIPKEILRLYMSIFKPKSKELK